MKLAELEIFWVEQCLRHLGVWGVSRPVGESRGQCFEKDFCFGALAMFWQAGRLPCLAQSLFQGRQGKCASYSISMSDELPLSS